MWHYGKIRSATEEELRPFFGRTLLLSVVDKAFKMQTASLWKLPLCMRWRNSSEVDKRLDEQGRIETYLVRQNNLCSNRKATRIALFS